MPSDGVAESGVFRDFELGDGPGNPVPLGNGLGWLQDRWSRWLDISGRLLASTELAHDGGRFGIGVYAGTGTHCLSLKQYSGRRVVLRAGDKPIIYESPA